MRVGRLAGAAERVTLVQEQAMANATEGIAMVERVSAAGDPAAIVSLAQTNRNREVTQQQPRAVAAADPPAGLSPRLRHILFGHVPGTDMAAGRRAYEAMEAAMGMGPEETEEAARARVMRQAQVEAQEAWMAERMREQRALADQLWRSRKEMAERRKEVAILEMECLFEKLAGERERKGRERFEKRGGGPLERLKIRVAESFRVLGGEVVSFFFSFLRCFHPAHIQMLDRYCRAKLTPTATRPPHSPPHPPQRRIRIPPRPPRHLLCRLPRRQRSR